MFHLSLHPERLNSSARSAEPEKVFQVLGDLRGKIIGDIGSGGGYFAEQFAKRVGPLGYVYAIDVNPHYLRHIEEIIQEKNISNLDTLHSHESSIPLARETVDILFSRNAFHHLQDPVSYFRKLSPVLKKDGMIVVIDALRPPRMNLRRILRHFSEEEHIILTLKEAGFAHSAKHSVYSDQSFNIFTKG